MGARPGTRQALFSRSFYSRTRRPSENKGRRHASAHALPSARILGARLPTDRPFISVAPTPRIHLNDGTPGARRRVLVRRRFIAQRCSTSKFARAHALYSVGLLAPERVSTMEMRCAIPMPGPVPRA
ncbi:hypothetical protein GSI_14503 [Ganoderma sinense ZZ0214-1]|uniref:Uncharacterized protein n=1 Tax=Ganoderma sinense ZZ0214-1 TaxID=1077348 RepID=A0A2G8RNU2_9APHY|nr:hypothetical protein GSI_14503 [Ganoderma sinense ZZ0214-1]